MARLTTEFWISAYRARLDLASIPAFVVHKGDVTAGAILIKVNTLDGQAQLFQRSLTLEGQSTWFVLSQGAETEVDQSILKQRQFDPDLWVIELESKEGRHLLDEEGLE